MINGDYTDATQFNRMICYLQIGDKSYFLYPVTNNPFGYLTPSTDVANGLLISKDNGLIINLKPANPVSSININSTASINEENTLNVNSNIRYTGYAALDERDELSEKQHDTYVKDMLKKNFPEAVLDTFYYENIDSINFQLALNLKYHIENYCDTTGAYTVFNLPFFTGIKDNPFTRTRRINPIDFSYSLLRNENINIELPEGYTISQLPEKRKTLITDLGFSQLYSSSQNHLECLRTFDLRSRQLLPQNYSRIKSLYDEMVSSSNDQIVLTKNLTGGK